MPVPVPVPVSVFVFVIVIGTATHAVGLFATGALHGLTGVSFEASLIRIRIFHECGATAGGTECNVIMPGSPQRILIHGHPTYGVKQLRHVGDPSFDMVCAM
jgi:hypothetical protein